jgi:hypothetical protein
MRERQKIEKIDFMINNKHKQSDEKNNWKLNKIETRKGLRGTEKEQWKIEN